MPSITFPMTGIPWFLQGDRLLTLPSFFKAERANFLLIFHVRNKGGNFRFTLLTSYPNAQQKIIFASFITKGESCSRREFLTIGRGHKTHYLEPLNSFRNTRFSRPTESLRCNNQLINEKLVCSPAEGEPFCIWEVQQSTGTHVVHPS